MQNIEYWKNEGAQKVFTHPISLEWLRNFDKKESVLDLGCGYGRLTPDLRKIGFSSIFGYDPSVSMIERAVHENPGVFYTSNIDELSGKSFGLILCFALFTSCPLGSEQSELASLINDFTQKNAWLYISDYETLDNPEYVERYEQRVFQIYGCFKSGTAIFRHHEPGHFDNLLPNWRKIEERTLNSKTLNGNEITIHQYLYTKG